MFVGPMLFKMQQVAVFLYYKTYPSLLSPVGGGGSMVELFGLMRSGAPYCESSSKREKTSGLLRFDIFLAPWQQHVQHVGEWIGMVWTA